MASDFKKPNSIHTLFPPEIELKMWPLPVRDLFFVGKASERKLHTLGIRTIGELAKCNKSLLISHMKKHGELIWNYANGVEFSDVVSEPESNKGYGNSTTLAFDVCDQYTAKKVLLALSETVAKRIRKDKVRIKVVSISIRYSKFTYFSHQKVIVYPTNITNEIHEAAGELNVLKKV